MNVKQLFDLSGKIALVTGGSRGLGLQMAEALGGMGAKVAIAARKADELEEAKARLEAGGIETLSVAADLSRPEQIPALTDAVLGKYGVIDILVNNAGANWAAPAEDYPDAAWHKLMRLNVDATFFLSREIGRRCMIPRRSGKIINIASVAGLSGNPPELRTVAYNASKGAVVNFTRALAAEWGRHNINVNALCPGFFPSKMTRGLLSQIGDRIVATTPLGRLGGDEDLMGAAVFLASAASRHITGQIITVDGGASIAR
ncbi:MAG: SDR family oxidoreductase [Zoogloeaceae bacterium]|jgi:gluconate 5-dehydrogenase|nr:SDR family oxidoreductase [Zoogloeaceae bacterium]